MKQSIYLTFAVMLLSACASFGDRQQEYRQALMQHDWPQAEQHLASANPGDANYLLYLLEMGSLLHYQQQWQESNQWLQQAETELLAWMSLGPEEQAKAWLINPEQAKFQAGLPELVQLYQLRIINSMMLANRGDQAALTSMRVDARRLELAIRQQQPGPLTELTDDTPSATLWSLLNPLGGVPQNAELWRYQDDAFSQWLIGLVYERLEEWDNARIFYAQAQLVCVQRERVQFQRAPEVCQQYELDRLRMAKRTGAPIAEAELSALTPEQQALLSSHDSRLVMLKRQGLLQPKRELNFRLFADPGNQSLVLEFIPTGDEQMQQEQWLWFLSMYGDLNPLNLFWRASTADPVALLDILTTKRFPLGPLWSQAEQLGVINALGPLGVRVTVPYVPLFQAQTPTQVQINGQSFSPLRVQDMQAIWQQQALLNAQTHLVTALTREISRNLVLQQGIRMANQGQNQEVFSLLGSMLTASLASSDTRMWLSLPSQHALLIQDLPPGSYLVDWGAQRQHIELAAQQIGLLLFTELRQTSLGDMYE